MRNAGAARGQRGMRKAKRRGGQPKLIEPERAIERKNVRLCSPMFAYVRLMGEKMLRSLMGNARKPQRAQNLEQAVGDGGERAAFKFLTVRDLKGGVQKWGRLNVGDSWNSPLRLERQSRAGRTPCVGESCEMHEMIKDNMDPGDLSIKSVKAKQTKPVQIRPIKASGANQGRSGQSNKGDRAILLTPPTSTYGVFGLFAPPTSI